MHRYLVLVLAGVVVRHGRAGHDASGAADAAAADKHRFGEHGLSAGGVADDGEVAQLQGCICVLHKGLCRPIIATGTALSGKFEA